MRIVVCGDSFSTKSPKNPGGHWSEILASKLNLDIYNIAVGGVGNAHIRLQLEASTKFNPVWVIVNATFPGRIEIPIHSTKSKLDSYSIFEFCSSYAKNPIMMSTPIAAIIEGITIGAKLSEEKKVAAENYLLHLYDGIWKKQVDNWLLSDGLKSLTEKKINVIFDHSLLDCDYHKLIENVNYVDEEHSLNQLNLTNRVPQELDPGHHLDQLAQEKLADYYARKLTSSRSLYKINHG